MPYALIRDGVIVERALTIEPGSLREIRGAKPYWLPVVEVVGDGYDADVHALEVSIEVGVERVTMISTPRERTADEWAALRARPLARIEAEFRRRWTAPLAYLGHEWHADEDAIRDISGVLDAYDQLERMKQPVPVSRSWTPKGSLVGVTVTRDELAMLGIMMATRKDALFTVKKAKAAEVVALASVSALAAYDATTGWE